MNRPRVLLVTDLAYIAKGRRYCDEDIALLTRLRRDFLVSMAHPLDAADLLDTSDIVLVRNTGATIHYLTEYRRFQRIARAAGVPVFNELTAQGDMAGKQYLVDLTKAQYPVIPTIADPADFDRLPDVPEYITKPMFGADSVGMRTLSRQDAAQVPVGDLIQPKVDFIYEVSFHFVDRTFHYALYAPDPERRWDLVPYIPTQADLAFAQKFVDWNSLNHGIQRIDACRTKEGELLLVELEDNNPYLSLSLVDADTRERFVLAMIDSMKEMLAS